MVSPWIRCCAHEDSNNSAAPSVLITLSSAAPPPPHSLIHPSCWRPEDSHSHPSAAAIILPSLERRGGRRRPAANQSPGCWDLLIGSEEVMLGDKEWCFIIAVFVFVTVAQKIVATKKKQQLSIGPCKSLPNSPSHSSVCATQVSAVHISQVGAGLGPNQAEFC